MTFLEIKIGKKGTLYPLHQNKTKSNINFLQCTILEHYNHSVVYLSMLNL